MLKLAGWLIFFVLLIGAYHGHGYLTAPADNCHPAWREYHKPWVRDEQGVLHIPDYTCGYSRFERWYWGMN